MTRAGPAWLRKFGRYLATGGFAAAVDLGAFSVLITFGDVPLATAAVLSFLVATVVNYLLSARFAFGAATSLRGYLRFLAAASLGLAINVGTTVVAGRLGAVPPLAKLLGIAVAFVINFALNLTLVFPGTRPLRKR